MALLFTPRIPNPAAGSRYYCLLNLEGYASSRNVLEAIVMISVDVDLRLRTGSRYVFLLLLRFSVTYRFYFQPIFFNL